MSFTTMCSDLDSTDAVWERIQARLRRNLTAALAELAEDDGLNDEDITTGSDLAPGIYRGENGEWLAWDYNPSAGDGLTSDDDLVDCYCCHTITVHESDLLKI